MKRGIFTLTGPLKGKTVVILDKYSFVDGVMTVGQNDALLMRTILCEHYACDLTFETVESEVEAEAGEGSLAVSATKQGVTENEKVAAQTLQSNLENAARVAGDK